MSAPVTLLDLRNLLRQVFTTEDAIDEWLDAKDSNLGWLSPREVASETGGPEKVKDLVLRMIHGIPP